MLDDFANPTLTRRRALTLAAYLRRGFGLALLLVIGYNIAMLVGVSAPEVPFDAGLRISLGLCLATALSGSFLGLFLAFYPVGQLPYLYKLPIASLAGALIVNAVIALAQSAPYLVGYLGALAA